jgi:hypothetical protein
MPTWFRIKRVWRQHPSHVRRGKPNADDDDSMAEQREEEVPTMDIYEPHRTATFGVLVAYSPRGAP